MKRIYLHIGTNKTGTSAVQKFFAVNAEELKKQGVLYPKLGRCWDAHFPVAWELELGKRPLECSKTNIIDAVLEEVTEHDCHTVVISCENFVLAKKNDQLSALKDAFKDFDVKMVMSIRRQDSWVESIYNQAVKMGVNVPYNIMKFSEQPGQLLDFEKIIKPWEDCFGSEAIIATKYEKKAESKNAVDVFLDLTGIAADSFDTGLNVNHSLDREILGFLIYNQGLFATQPERNKFIKFYNEKIKKHQENSVCELLTRQNRIDILKKYQKSNSRFAKKYFGEDVLFPDKALCDSKPFHPAQEARKIINYFIKNPIDAVIS